MRTVALGLVLGIVACSADNPPMSGYAEAELVYVAPTSAGLLAKIAVRRGDRVKQGQPLFALEADAEILARDAAASRAERARAVSRNLKQGRRPSEIHVIEQQLAQAQAALVASGKALERQRQLVAQGFVSAGLLDELVAARDRDGARVRELQAQLVVARQAARGDEIAAADAEARGSAAELAVARWREGQRSRSAPVDAEVFDVMFREGEVVGAGMPVVALLPPRAVKVRFFVTEPDLARAAVGAEVRVSCDGCAAPLAARIRFVSPSAEFTPPVILATGSRARLVYMAEAEPFEPGQLRPGQPVDVRFAAR